MPESIIDRYWFANSVLDSKVLRDLRDPDWIAEWPQSGEVIRGHDNDVLINEHHPGYPLQERRAMARESGEWALSPLLLPVMVRGEGDTYVGEALFTYPDKTYHTVGVFELSNNRVLRERIYWAEQLPAPNWRRSLTEPLPSGIEERRLGSPDRDLQARRRDAIERTFRDPTAAGGSGDRVAARRAYRDAVADLFHPDGIQDLPQSGERIRGLTNILAVIDGHPDFPTSGTLRKITSIGDLFVVEGGLRYEGAGRYEEVMLMEFRDEKVAHSTDYYAAAFDPPAWRSDWVELA
jgi:hypothetical protein